MKNRISMLREQGREDEDRREPQAIGEILTQLLAEYSARFPEARITVVETPAVAV